ncbi:MAG: toll/interleukin-1 receptor domain-containing protein [Verrucomicrobiota bacterium]
MAPEHPPELVIFDSRFADGKLKGDLYYIEVPIGERLRVAWEPEQQPENFQPVGGGVAYVFQAEHVSRLHVAHDAVPDDLGKLRYRWSEGLNHGIPWIMFVLILPTSYTIRDPSLVPARAKLFHGRLALYWILKGDNCGRTTVACTLRKFAGDPYAKLVQLNQICSQENLPENKFIRIEDDLPGRQRHQFMKATTQPRVFISHSSKDKPFVRKLVAELKKHKLSVWLDEQEIQIGDSIVSKISGGLRDSDYFVIVLSKASVTSPWVQVELNSALIAQISNQGVAVLPVLIEDCDIPTLLRDRLYADFRTDFAAGLGKLLSVLQQEGESAAGLGTTTTTTTTSTTLPPGAVPCAPTLAALSLGELRRRITKRMSRTEIATIWFDLFQTKMEDDMAQRPLVDCVIELLDRANKRAKLGEVIAGICADRSDLVNPQ